MYTHTHAHAHTHTHTYTHTHTHKLHTHTDTHTHTHTHTGKSTILNFLKPDNKKSAEVRHTHYCCTVLQRCYNVVTRIGKTHTSVYV
jgi:hypothetical protein